MQRLAGLIRTNRPCSGLKLVEAVLDIGKVDPPRRRNPHLVADTGEQSNPEIVFQILDLAADRTGRHVQLERGLAEILQPARGFKRFDGIERGKRHDQLLCIFLTMVRL